MSISRCVWCGVTNGDGRNVCVVCESDGPEANARTLLKRINKMAEADMLKGNPITGAHSRAINKVLEELK